MTPKKGAEEADDGDVDVGALINQFAEKSTMPEKDKGVVSDDDDHGERHDVRGVRPGRNKTAEVVGLGWQPHKVYT